MAKLRALWDLMRLEHGVMLFLAILVGALISQKEFGMLQDKLFFAFLTVLFLEASTFALNDYFDYEVDKKNKRLDRPLVRGDIAPKTVLYLFFILFPLGILSSLFVNFTCFGIALVTALFAILYDVWMKKVKLLGNFFIAYTMAIPFVFGGTAVSASIPPVVFLLAVIAFLAGSGREIMKDVMDFEGDSEKGVKSLPKYVGERRANVIAAFFYLIAIVISFIPFLMEIDAAYYLNYYYLALVLVTDGMLASTSLQLIVQKDVKRINMPFHRRFTLIALFVGLIAFLVGAFVRYS